jgi:hypothetical protein
MNMAKDWRDLEDDLVETIRQCCTTEQDKKEALRYFQGVSVVGMIEEALME